LKTSAQFATFAVVSLKLFLHRVKVRKPFPRTYLVAMFRLQGQPASFNRLKRGRQMVRCKIEGRLTKSAPAGEPLIDLLGQERQPYTRC